MGGERASSGLGTPAHSPVGPASNHTATSAAKPDAESHTEDPVSVALDDNKRNTPKPEEPIGGRAASNRTATSAAADTSGRNSERRKHASTLQSEASELNRNGLKPWTGGAKWPVDSELLAKMLEAQELSKMKDSPTINKLSKRMAKRGVKNMMAWEERRQQKIKQLQAQKEQIESRSNGTPKVSKGSEKRLKRRALGQQDKASQGGNGKRREAPQVRLYEQAEIIKKGKNIVTIKGELYNNEGKLASTLIHSAMIVESDFKM